MSFQAVEWVLRHSPARGTDRLVLVAIAAESRDRSPTGGAWSAWPGVETIRSHAALDRARTATDSLGRLVRDGAIERVVNGAPTSGRRDRRPNLYRVLLANGVRCDDTRCQSCGVRPGDTPQPVGRGVAGASDGVSPERSTGCAAATPDPLEEPVKEPKPSGNAADIDAAPVDDRAGKPAGGISETARKLARNEWDRRSPKPVCPLPAIAARVQEAIDAGHSPEAIADALPKLTAFSRNAVDFALGQPKTRRTRVVTMDRDGPSGRVAAEDL